MSAENGLANVPAWRYLLQQLDSKRVATLSHPSDVLRVALQHYAAHGVSSSGVEQAFSKCSWYISSRRQLAGPLTEEYLFKLACDLPHNNLAEVTLLARRVWAMCFGVSRLWVRRRLDKGLKRPRADACHLTEAAFVRKRRLASDQAAVEVGHVVDMTAFVAPELPTWTEALGTEMAHQQDKYEQKRMQALGEGSLLPSETSTALERTLRDAQARRLSDHQARQRKAARDELALRGATADTVLQALWGMAAYIDDEFTGAYRARLQQSLLAANLREADNRSAATVLVVANFGKLGQRTLWTAVLKGGFLVHHHFLLRNAGPVVKYAASACPPARLIYVSARWKAYRPGIFNALEGALNNLAGSAWTLEFDIAKYVACKRTAIHKRKSARALALVRDDEKTLPDTYGFNHTLVLVASL